MLKLGRPSINAVQGVTKTIAYDDIGVSYYLTKGKAYSFTLTRAKGGDGAMVRRFLHTVLP